MASQPFTLSDDGPFYADADAVAAAATLKPGAPQSVTTAAVKTLLSFGFQRPGSQIQLDLYDAATGGLGAKIEGNLKEMLAGPGSIRRTIKKHLAAAPAAKL